MRAIKDKLLKPTMDKLQNFPRDLSWHEDTFIKPRDEFVKKARSWIDEQAKEISLTGSGIKALDELTFALSIIRKPNGEDFLTDYMKCMRWYHLMKSIPHSSVEDTTKFFDKLYLLMDLASDDEILERLKLDKGNVIDYIDEIFPNQLGIIHHMEHYPVYKTADKYVGYCAKHLFVAMASQYNDSDYDFDLTTNEQVKFMYELYALYEYDAYHLDDDADNSKWKKLETFRNRAVPKELKSSSRSK